MNILIINATLSFFATLLLHDLGHYFAARMCDVPIKRVGLRGRPNLYGVRLSNLHCNVRLLPFGAYLQMDMLALQRPALIPQLLVLGAGIGVTPLLAGLACGSPFGALNLALA